MRWWRRRQAQTVSSGWGPATAYVGRAGAYAPGWNGATAQLDTAPLLTRGQAHRADAAMRQGR